MTAPFAGAAARMAGVLGAEGFPFVSIEHPISSAGAEALAARAVDAADAATRLLAGAA